MSVKYHAAPSSLKFHIPSTLASDFKNFLNMDVPGQVGDCEVLHDWYAQFEPGYDPIIERVEIYPDSTKSRYENTDNNINARFAVDADVYKGDIIIKDGTTYVLDWEVPPEHNNRASRSLRCNISLTVFRHVPEETDDEGYVITPEHNENIVEELPSNAYRYDGRPEFSATAGTPGVVANALTLMTVQYNSKTKNIHVDDKFVWGDQEYTIIDINWVGINYKTNTGTLKIQAKKTAGGLDEH